MILTGQIKKDGSHYVAILEPLGAYADGRTRAGAHDELAAMILEIADHYAPNARWKVTVTDDGEDTLYVTSNDTSHMLALLLRRQRIQADMSLADVAKATGGKSRNGWAQYEQGRSQPSIDKLQAMLDVVAPDLTVAIIPRTARVLSRWEEENADELADIDRLIDDPSPENVERIRLKWKARRATKAASDARTNARTKRKANAKAQPDTPKKAARAAR
jgi:transcriptional regulator with XRE-family HTH domain